VTSKFEVNVSALKEWLFSVLKNLSSSIRTQKADNPAAASEEKIKKV
jgi:hypothetical protein